MIPWGRYAYMSTWRMRRQYTQRKWFIGLTTLVLLLLIHSSQ